MRISRCTLLLSLLMAVALPGYAEIKVGADGLKVIYNEAPVHRARRVAQRLVRVPEEKLDEFVGRYAERHRLEPKLVRAVIQVESGYNAAARSVKGAMGLMQLMPGTARELGVDDPYDPEQNIRGGVSYLRQMLDRFEENLVHALAGYNAGPDAVVQYGGVPPYAETRAYVERVMRLVRGDGSFSLPSTRRGRPTYLTRGPDGRPVITTRRP